MKPLFNVFLAGLLVVSSAFALVVDSIILNWCNLSNKLKGATRFLMSARTY